MLNGLAELMDDDEIRSYKIARNNYIAKIL